MLQFVDQVASCKFARGGFATWCLIMLERTGRIKTGVKSFGLSHGPPCIGLSDVIFKLVGKTLFAIKRSIMLWKRWQSCEKHSFRMRGQSPSWPVASSRFRFWRNTIKFAGYNRVES